MLISPSIVSQGQNVNHHHHHPIIIIIIIIIIMFVYLKLTNATNTVNEI